MGSQSSRFAKLKKRYANMPAPTDVFVGSLPENMTQDDWALFASTNLDRRQFPGRPRFISFVDLKAHVQARQDAEKTLTLHV